MKTRASLRKRRGKPEHGIVVDAEACGEFATPGQPSTEVTGDKELAQITSDLLVIRYAARPRNRKTSPIRKYTSLPLGISSNLHIADVQILTTDGAKGGVPKSDFEKSRNSTPNSSVESAPNRSDE